MKNYLKFLVFITFGMILTLISCSEDLEDSKNVNLTLSNESLTKDITRHVYFSSWDEWGRASRDCNGWGLCNFTDCWGCCIDTDTNKEVDCKSGSAKRNAGTARIDATSGLGFLKIQLDPIYEDHEDAINNQKTLYIDDNLIGEVFTIVEGSYSFDSEIGSNGGYSVDVMENE